MASSSKERSETVQEIGIKGTDKLPGMTHKDEYSDYVGRIESVQADPDMENQMKALGIVDSFSLYDFLADKNDNDADLWHSL